MTLALFNGAFLQHRLYGSKSRTTMNWKEYGKEVILSVIRYNPDIVVED